MVPVWSGDSFLTHRAFSSSQLKAEEAILGRGPGLAVKPPRRRLFSLRKMVERTANAAAGAQRCS